METSQYEVEWKVCSNTSSDPDPRLNTQSPRQATKFLLELSLAWNSNWPRVVNLQSSHTTARGKEWVSIGSHTGVNTPSLELSTESGTDREGASRGVVLDERK